jgi:hypothetical protein
MYVLLLFRLCETLIKVQWLDVASISHPLRRQMLYFLVKLAAASKRLPSSIYTPGVALISGPCHGGYANIYRGIYKDTVVAIKQLRSNEDDPDPFTVCHDLIYTT